MPELPEVEAARKLAELHCAGKKIVAADVREDTKVFKNATVAETETALLNRTVQSVLRKGKYFWFTLSGEGPDILFHFGMTGYLAVKGHGAAKYVKIKEDAEWPPRFLKLELTFDDGTVVAFMDARRFAKIHLFKDPNAHTDSPLLKMGPDCLTALPDVAAFTALLATQRRALKAVFLDQSVLSGIGNWVADEVLYQARVYPELPACNLTPEQAAALHAAIVSVIAHAVEIDADSKRMPKDWLFHYRWTGKAASKDGHGNHIKFLEVGGRTTAWVPALQPKQSAQPKAKAAGAGPSAAAANKRAAKRKAAAAADAAGEAPADAGVVDAAAEAGAAIAQEAEAEGDENGSVAPESGAAVAEAAAGPSADAAAEAEPAASDERPAKRRGAAAGKAAAGRTRGAKSDAAAVAAVTGGAAEEEAAVPDAATSDASRAKRRGAAACGGAGRKRATRSDHAEDVPLSNAGAEAAEQASAEAVAAPEAASSDKRAGKRKGAVASGGAGRKRAAKSDATADAPGASGAAEVAGVSSETAAVEKRGAAARKRGAPSGAAADASDARRRSGRSAGSAPQVAAQVTTATKTDTAAQAAASGSGSVSATTGKSAPKRAKKVAAEPRVGGRRSARIAVL